MIKTNTEQLVCQSVIGEITSPQGGINPYRINPDGHSDVYPGVGGITYNLRIGDLAGEKFGDHVEPAVSISNFTQIQGQPGPNRALNQFACAGNLARIISGEAKGQTGRVTGNSGGFAYSPTESKAGETTTADGQKILKPYGSMTYAGLLSFIYAYVDKNDPRVQSAYNWIRANYTLEENPGLRTDAAPNLGKQGLFYYYHTFAKALSAYGEKKIITANGQENLWAEQLVTKLASIQSVDGSWKNENSRWWEDLPILATSYSLMSLNLCRKSVE